MIKVGLGRLKLYENNPRKNNNAIDKVAKSIEEFGFRVPIIIDKTDTIICGHTRYFAALEIGLEEAPCIVVDDLTDEKIRAFRIVDNKCSEFAEWDDDLLQAELALIDDIDMSEFGFDEDVDFDEIEIDNSPAKGSLREKYIAPPFSVIDTRSGEWQDRKRLWGKILNSEKGRKSCLLTESLRNLEKKHGMKANGTSVFDPVLCETLINWFCPKNGKIIDPFAGGSVRGIVSVFLGRKYAGIDIRDEQIIENIKQFEKITNLTDVNGNALQRPEWICGDSMEMDNLVNGEFDFILTCPPYADLEVYSDNPNDISTMKYPSFRAAYFEIIKKTVAKLKENAFAAVVVGEVRDKKGFYRSFVPDTIDAFKNAGMEYYNEAVLLNAIGTGAIRVNKTFGAKRKLIKTHQNVLVFVKGKPEKIKLETVDYDINALKDAGFDG